AAPTKANWDKLLTDNNPLVRAETVRWFRAFKGKAEMTELLGQRAPELILQDLAIKDDLVVVLRHLEAPAALMQKWNLTSPDVDKDTLGRDVLGAVAKLSKAEVPQRVFLGRQVFERAGCTKCHTTVTENTPLAPTLKGIATAQKADYLVESVIYPSKVIKT